MATTLHRKAVVQNGFPVIWLSRRSISLRQIACLTITGVIAWCLLAWVSAEALITRADLSHADAIVVLSNASTYKERTGLAAELWKQKRAPKLLLTNDNTLSSWSESEQRNPFFYELATRELTHLGVAPEQIGLLPEPVNSTYEEAVLVRQYAADHDLHSVLIVTSAYHSRRALKIFRRVFQDSGILIGLQAVPPGNQTPSPYVWWLASFGWRTVVPEYPKLAYFWLRQLFGNNPETTPSYRLDTSRQPVGEEGILQAPPASFVDEVILVDARRATGISRLPQRDGSPSVILDFGDGFSTNLLASGHAYRTSGTYTIKLKAKNESGQIVAEAERVITVTDIPAATGANVRRLNDTNNPATNSLNLQRAIDVAARANSTEQEIVLPAGARFAGTLVLTAPTGPQSGAKYITIRSAGLDSIPVRGNRVGPASRRFMPIITAPTSAGPTQPAVKTLTPAPGYPAHHYRLQGLLLKKEDDTTYVQRLMDIGTDVGGGQRKISQVPHHFIIDRCWFDGGTLDNAYSKDGLRIYGDYVSVVDSQFAEFKIVTGPDSTGISLNAGRGPFAFWNNEFVAGSENFSVGGDATEKNRGTVSSATTSGCTLSDVTNLEIDQNIAFKVDGSYSVAQSTVVRSISGNRISFDPIRKAPDLGSIAEWIAEPSFVEFRRNYLYKPLKWWSRHPSWNGMTYQIKNLWELKFGRYFVIDGNLMENSWAADQAFALAISPRNGYGGFSAASVVREMQWSNNIIRNAANGINIANTDYAPGSPSQLLTDITFRNNLFWNVGYNFDPHCGGCQLMTMQNFHNVRMKRIFFIHNTDDNGIPDNSNRAITDFGDTGGADDSMWLNNLHQDGGYGFKGVNGLDAAANIASHLPPGDARNWNKNLIANSNGHSYPPPPRGFYPSGPWPAMFVNYEGGDFTLVKGRPGKNKATDGFDIGVIMPALISATVHCKDGQWMPGDSSVPAAKPTVSPLVRPRTVTPSSD